MVKNFDTTGKTSKMDTKGNVSIEEGKSSTKLFHGK
jgi:hypothetical protein